MSTVKAKFVCTGKEPTDVAYGPGENLSFMAVVGGEPHDENTSFFNSTPAGSLSLHCVNPKANENIELGKEYYLVIEPA